MKDDMIIKKIVNELIKYDYLDVMAKISLLNTIYKNQESNSLIAYLIDNMIKEKNSNSHPIISLSHFKKIIRELDTLSISIYIDPVENLFYDAVCLDKRYFSYENINLTPSYILNHLICAINLLSNNKGTEEFVCKATMVTKYLLSLQNNLIVDSKQVNPNKRDYKREIYYFDSHYFNNMKKHIIIDYSDAVFATNGEIDNLIVNDELLNKFESNNIKGVYPFFSAPFLKINDKLIVLDPTMLTIACNNYLILLSQHYNLTNELIDNYIESIVLESKKSIIKIDNPHNVYSFNSSQRRIKYLVEEFSEKKALLHIFVADDVNTYSLSSFLEQSSTINFFIDEKIETVVNEVKNRYDDLCVNISIITFGRGFAISSNIDLPCIMLTPFQLEVISKNRRISNNILYYFTKDHFINNKFSEKSSYNVFGDFRYFIVYEERYCSFYMNDSIPQSEITLYVEFDVIYEYVYKALSLKNYDVISYENNLIKIENIENNTFFGIIDNLFSFVIKGDDERFISINYEEKEIDLLNKMSEFLSFWFSESISFLNFSRPYYFLNLSYSAQTKDVIVKEMKKNHFKIIFGDNDILLISKDNFDNTNEKTFFLIILSYLGLTILESDINKIFNNKLKKKIYTINYEKFDFLIPSSNEEFPIPIASQSKMSFLLDDICQNFINRGIVSVGDTIKGSDRSKICNNIVESVYESFVAKISSYNFASIINIAYVSLEKLIPEIVLRTNNYKNQIHLYAKKEKEIREMLSEYSASSVSLRFILEYVGAIQHEGKLKCDIIDLEDLMAYVKTILDWATASDAFMYDMIDDEIKILESKRFGYNKENIENLQNYLSSTQFDYLSKEKKDNSFSISILEKNNIFMKDYGYDFELYISIIKLLFEYGDTISSEVKTINIDKWIKLCDAKNVPKILYNVIDDFSIEKRDDYFKYKYYMTREFYPWRFNRLFSLFRRPLIRVNDKYYYGNRNLIHNIYYISKLIDEGIFNSGKRGKNYSIKYNGVIAEKRGKLFNEEVARVFETFTSMETYQNVVSINSKHISDEEGNDLGDIDVLSISKNLRKIYVVEVKDYSLAKNFNDLSIEIKKLFEGTEDSKPDYEKHINRFTWVLNHKDDIIKEYKLNGTNWQIIPLFITNQPMVSHKYKKFKNINLIDIGDLNYNYLKNLKTIKLK